MIQRNGHGKAVDWYLLGVVIYEMVTGIPPFYSNDKKVMMKNILKQKLRLPRFVSKNARGILKLLLTREPDKRLGSGKFDAQIVKSHPWFKDVNWDDVYNKKLPVPTSFSGEMPDQSRDTISSRLVRAKDDMKDNIKFHNYIQGWSFHNEGDTILQ